MEQLSFVVPTYAFPSGTYVSVEKLSPSSAPKAPTPDKEDYIYGEYNFGKSVPSGYSVEGFTCGEIALGLPLRILRCIRNGVNVAGNFITSPIQSVAIEKKGDTFDTACSLILRTENSVYVMRKKDEPKDQLLEPSPRA